MQTKKGYTVHEQGGKLYIMLSVHGQSFKCLLGNAKHLKEIEGFNIIPNEEYFSKTVEMISRARNVTKAYCDGPNSNREDCLRLIDDFLLKQENPETVFYSYVKIWVNVHFDEKEFN